MLLGAAHYFGAVTTVDTSPGGRIRRAVRADLMAVVRIERKVFDQPWRATAFEEFLEGGGFLVMEDPAGVGVGEDIAGYVVADTVEIRGRNVGHVKDLAVKPERQGEGRGRALLQRALGFLSGRGVSFARLEVRSTNERAIDLYVRNGFQRSGRVEGYYPDGEDAYVLVKPLDGFDGH